MRTVALVVGSLLMGLSVNLFLIPLRLAEGGAIGVAILVYHTLGVRTELTFLAVNVPLMLVAWRLRGYRFVVRSLVGVGLFTAAIFVTSPLVPVTKEPLLGIVYGGLLLGLGLGLVLRAGATTGGTDLLATLLHRGLGLSVGSLILAIDALVLMGAGLVLGWEQALYAAITLMISSRVVDYVQEGAYGAKAVTIVTDAPAAVAKEILAQIERGCTILSGIGAFTGTARPVLYSVVQRSELSTLKNIVYTLDPQAFMVVGDVREVLGEGFQVWEKPR